MANMILTVIGIVFAAALMGGGLAYFSPSLMAEFQVANRIIGGFRQLSAAHAAYVVANKTLPDAGAWESQLYTGYTYRPPFPQLNRDMEDGTPATPIVWSYGHDDTDGDLIGDRPYFCLQLDQETGSGEVSSVVFRAMRSAGLRYSRDINRTLAEAGSAIAIDSCDDIDTNRAALDSLAVAQCGANATIQSCILGRPRMELRLGGCGAQATAVGGASDQNHPICWGEVAPEGDFGLVFLID